MEQRISPWVRRALQGNLPVGVAGGTPYSREDDVEVTPVMGEGLAWSSSRGSRAAVPIEADESATLCMCGERHRGWSHREMP